MALRVRWTPSVIDTLQSLLVTPVLDWAYLEDAHNIIGL